MSFTRHPFGLWLHSFLSLLLERVWMAATVSVCSVSPVWIYCMFAHCSSSLLCFLTLRFFLFVLSSRSLSRFGLVWKEYASSVFCSLRHLWGVSPDQFLSSLCSLDRKLQAQTSQGKSDSFFFFSHDHRFALKTLSHTECSFLRKVRPGWWWWWWWWCGLTNEWGNHTLSFSSSMVTECALWSVVMAAADDMMMTFSVSLSVSLSGFTHYFAHVSSFPHSLLRVVACWALSLQNIHFFGVVRTEADDDDDDDFSVSVCLSVLLLAFTRLFRACDFLSSYSSSSFFRSLQTEN